MNDVPFADPTRDWIRMGRDTVEVIRLKLRIIGFSNKLTGLYARLGEQAFGAAEQGEDFTAREAARKLMDDIREARREIAEAETAIRRVRGEATPPAADQPAPAPKEE